MAAVDLNLSDEQATGRACIACGKPGDQSDGRRVGVVDGTPVWACVEGCMQLIGILGGRS
jgi:hypothetical protein